MNDSNNRSNRLMVTLVVLSAVASIAAVAATVMGVSVARQAHHLDQLQQRLFKPSVAQAASLADSDPANRHVTLVSSDGTKMIDVVMVGNTQGFVTGGNLPDLSGEQAYQLWATADGNAISLGLLGRQANAAAFQLPAKTTALIVTAEASTGAVTSTRTPVAQGSLPK